MNAVSHQQRPSKLIGLPLEHLECLTVSDDHSPAHMIGYHGTINMKANSICSSRVSSLQAKRCRNSREHKLLWLISESMARTLPACS